MKNIVFPLILLIILSLTTCSSTDVKYRNFEDLPRNAIFYPDSKVFKFPMCQYLHSLCINPDDCTITRGGDVRCNNLPNEFLNSISEIGTIIGEVEVKYYWPYMRKQNFYIIHENNNGYLFMKKNIIGSEEFFKIKNNKYTPIVTGESNGLKVDIDLYHTSIVNNGRSNIFIVKIKNSRNESYIFNTTTNKIILSLGNKKRRVDNQLFLYDFCTGEVINTNKLVLSGKEREFFAVSNYSNDNDMIGMQMMLNFTQIIIDGIGKGIGSVNSNAKVSFPLTYSGSFQMGRDNKTINLSFKIIKSESNTMN